MSLAKEYPSRLISYLKKSPFQNDFLSENIFEIVNQDVEVEDDLVDRNI